MGLIKEASCMEADGTTTLSGRTTPNYADFHTVVEALLHRCVAPRARHVASQQAIGT